MKRRGLRLFLDIALGAMLVFEMFYMLTGNALHEIVGAAFFLTLVIHITLSRKWISAVRAGSALGCSVSAKHKIRLGICIAIGVMGFVLLASSILISNLLGSLTGWMPDPSVYRLCSLAHTASAYGLCVLTVCHVGAHWIGLFKAMGIRYNPERRRAIGMGVASVAAIGVAALGGAGLDALGAFANAGGAANDAAKAGGEGEASSGVERNSDEIAGSASDAGGNGASSAGNGNGSSGAGNSAGTGASVGNGLGAGRKNGKAQSSKSVNSESPGGSSTGSESSNRNSTGTGSFENESSSSSASAICTLCGKHCLLSSPRCNKPYMAGLI